MNDKESKMVFISHSKKDKKQAITLSNLLRRFDIQAWLDNEQIKPGDPILLKIEEGLKQSDAILFLVSADSKESPWCRAEYSVLLHKEIVSGETLVVPIKLDDTPLPVILSDKRYLNLSDLIEDENTLFELADFVLGGIGRKTNKKNTRHQIINDQIPLNLVENLIFLVIGDQFPKGVWGRSLIDAVGAYGHKDDPGSITVSLWAVEALCSAYPKNVLSEVQLFSDYLIKRRNPENGAIGMLKHLPGHVDEFLIIDNRRHTARGAQYLKDFDGKLDLALESIKYVIRERTDGGAWSATGISSDEKADPLTTAAVLRVLKNFEREGLLHKISFEKRDLFLAEYWKRGLLWMYKNLIENEGWWIYKTSKQEPGPTIIKRTYSYTAEILLNLPEFWREDIDYENHHEKLMNNIMKIWDKEGIGIPTGPGVKKPNLETTALFAAACWRCKDRYPQLANEAKKRFIKNIESLLDSGECDAAGWSMSLIYLLEMLKITKPGLDSYQKNKELVDKVWDAHKNNSQEIISDLQYGYPDWVYKSVIKQIKTADVVPP